MTHNQGEAFAIAARVGPWFDPPEARVWRSALREAWAARRSV